MPDNTCVCCGAIIPEGRHICLLCEGENEVQRFCIPDAAAILTACDELEALITDADIEDKNLKHRLLHEIVKRIEIIRKEVRKP